MVASPESTARQLEKLMAEFNDLLEHRYGVEFALYEAKVKLDELRHRLDHERAVRLAEGIEGKNSEQREAGLRLALVGLYSEVQSTEAMLAKKRLDSELAGLEWDVLRYRLRALESISQTKD